MNKIIKFPIWLFELITTTKSFKDNPIIGSPLLNRLGLHVIRLVISHAFMRGRMLMLSLPVSAQNRKSFFKDGYIAVESFLSEEEFDVLEKEARTFKGEIREARQGNTLTHRGVLSPEVLEEHPALNRMIMSRKLTRLTRFSSGHFRAPFYYLEDVKNKYCEGVEDPQKTLHADTFHPSMKFWFFIDDVTDEMGPFTFVPGSHKLTWKRLKWQYRMSLNAKDANNALHAKGSTRYTAEDLVELGLPEPYAFTMKKNTLLIANVFGIHRRGDSLKKSTRLSLWGDSRTNPFIPFPGLGGKHINQLQYYFLGLFRTKADESAVKRGVRSPWKVIETEDE